MVSKSSHIEDTGDQGSGVILALAILRTLVNSKKLQVQGLRTQ
jgi:hypothetical protein